MKALSLRPAFAWAVIHAGKSVENRTWSTDYRGPLAIHASGSIRGVDDDFARVSSISGQPIPKEYQTGEFIGIVDLVDVLKPDRIDMLSRSEWVWANAGCYLWVLTRPRAVKSPEVPGKLRLWDVDDRILRF